jgi:hypothetical protein
VNHERDQGRSHDQPSSRAREIAQLAVDAHDAPLKFAEQIGGGGLGGEQFQGLDHGVARNVAAAVAAHAVGDRPKADLRLREHAVLIQPSDQTHMADHRRAEDEPAGHDAPPSAVSCARAKSPVNMSAKRVAG